MPRRAEILLVDDEEALCTAAEKILAKEGYHVTTVNTAKDGLAKFESDATDLLITDLMLPDLDGRLVCEILRAQPFTRDVPVVVLSALDRPLPGSRGAKIRVAHWLKKGSDLAALGDCVRAALEEHLARVARRLSLEERSQNASTEAGDRARP